MRTGWTPSSGGSEAEARLLLRGYDAGRLVKEGVRTAIAGRTNAGKSSLMNLLSGGEHSIVTDAPGTTRDIVERPGERGRREADFTGHGRTAPG